MLWDNWEGYTRSSRVCTCPPSPSYERVVRESYTIYLSMLWDSWEGYPSSCRPVNSPTSGERLLWFDILSHSPASTLWFFRIQQKMSFLIKIKHISLVLLVTELWTSTVDEHLSKKFKIRAISSCSYWSVFNVAVPIFTQSKLFYIDNCLYIAVDTFANYNFIRCLKINFTLVWCKLK